MITNLFIFYIGKGYANLKNKTISKVGVMYTLDLQVLTVITALALLSAKSKPSLTLPRHTAKKRAPL